MPTFDCLRHSHGLTVIVTGAVAAPVICAEGHIATLDPATLAGSCGIASTVSFVVGNKIARTPGVFAGQIPCDPAQTEVRLQAAVDGKSYRYIARWPEDPVPAVATATRRSKARSRQPS